MSMPILAMPSREVIIATVDRRFYPDNTGVFCYVRSDVCRYRQVGLSDRCDAGCTTQVTDAYGGHFSY